MLSKFLRNSTSILTSNGSIKNVCSRSASSSLGYNQALSYAPATKLDVLGSGLRVASEDNGSPSTTLGLWIDAGSRQEKYNKNGLGNLFEHTVFKGTNNLSGVELEKLVKSLGARFEITRGREATGITATCMTEDVPKIVEILADVVQNASFSEEEIAAQKVVMLDKLEKAESTDPEGVMQDFLHSVAFQGTSLAHSLLGTTETINGLTREDLLDFRRDYLVGPQMVLSSAGGVSQDSLAQLATKHFNKCDGSNAFAHPTDYCRFTGSEMRVRDDDMKHAHIIVGFHTPGINDEDFLSLEVAKTLTGHWDTTLPSLQSGVILANKFNKHNMVQSYKTFNLGYKDSGLFGIYLVCGRMRIMASQEMIADAFNHLCDTVSEADVERAKNQLRTSIFTNLESNSAIAQDIGLQILQKGKRSTVAELEHAIDNVSAKTLTEVCDKYIFDACHAQAGLGPIEQMFTYVVYRKKFKWFRI